MARCVHNHLYNSEEMKKFIPHILAGLFFVGCLFLGGEAYQARKERDSYKKYVEGEFVKNQERIRDNLQKNAEMRLWIQRNYLKLLEENKRLRAQDSLSNLEIAKISGRYKNKTSEELQRRMLEEYANR
jgi:hypothetical protein